MVTRANKSVKSKALLGTFNEFSCIRDRAPIPPLSPLPLMENRDFHYLRCVSCFGVSQYKRSEGLIRSLHPLNYKRLPPAELQPSTTTINYNHQTQQQCHQKTSRQLLKVAVRLDLALGMLVDTRLVISLIFEALPRINTGLISFASPLSSVTSYTLTHLAATPGRST